MPTTTTIFGISKPASGAEPANGYGALTALADSVETALLGMRGQHVAKGSDQVFSSNALADDSALQFTVEALGVYEVQGVIWYLASTAGSPSKVSMSLPSGTFDFAATIQDSGAAAFLVWAAPSTASDTEISFSALTTTRIPMIFRARVAVGASAGTVKMRFKDDTDADTLTVKAGSWLTARKVA